MSTRPLSVTACIAGLACTTSCGWNPWGASSDEVGNEPETSGRRYFIAEITDYSSPLANCPQASLNDVTTLFQMTLESDGWQGTRRSEGQTIPADFLDPAINAGGHDDIFADAVPVAVFAGHGDRGLHLWPVNGPPFDLCHNATAGYYLGTGSGDESTVFINAASCGGAFGDDLAKPESCFNQTWGNSEFRQWLGFIDSPTIGSYSLSEFFLSLATNPSMASGQLEPWLLLMEFPVEGVHNLPIVYTKLSDDEPLDLAEALHFELNMRSGRYMDAANPEPKQDIAMSPTIGEIDTTLFCTDPPFSC
ncbi:hypothetical protein ACNOYE_03940 [Nannocystaceae bacterium ST9]